MKIGIDLSVLQSAHRMRGIGSAASNFINNISEEDKKIHEFIFYTEALTDNPINPLDSLDLSNVSYRLVEIEKTKQISVALPGPIILSRIVNASLRYLRFRMLMSFGDKRIAHLNELDCYLQFDQNQPLPSRRSVKSLIIAYDIIPYVLESDYLWSYKTARLRGCSRKGAIRCSLRRRLYKTNTRQILKNAHKIIAISQHTRNDLIRYIGIQPNKIIVALLGVNPDVPTDNESTPAFNRYIQTSWGDMPKSVTIEKYKYLLFMGGVDPRRKVVDLVAAYNNLKARGVAIKLVLAGDTMYGPFSVPSVELQKYFKDTSYLDDIYFMGFVDNIQRDWLYKHALAFVYPSVYEGFGLPIIEAMERGCPVITYENTSIKEVAGDAALFAKNTIDILQHVQSLMADGKIRDALIKKGQKQASRFSWAQTTSIILSEAVDTMHSRR